MVPKGGSTVVTRRVACSDQKVDVAAFEVEDATPGKAGLEPVDLDRIHDGRTGCPTVKARLIGYPGQWVTPLKSLPGVQGFRALSYGCEPIEPSRWDAVSKKAGLSPDIHVVVDYGDDHVTFEGGGLVSADAPNPRGMSGGGMFQPPKPTKAKQIWNPADMCLFAIQSSWLDEVGFLKAIQIIHWLKLVAEEYPDLRSELQSRFPRLKRMCNESL